MDNESYSAGWDWASDKLRDRTPLEVRLEGQGAAHEDEDPDAFFEGVLDRLKKSR